MKCVVSDGLNSTAIIQTSVSIPKQNIWLRKCSLMSFYHSIYIHACKERDRESLKLQARGVYWYIPEANTSNTYLTSMKMVDVLVLRQEDWRERSRSTYY
jgi:hypothetical protein